jgi:hypothetical protein
MFRGNILSPSSGFFRNVGINLKVHTASKFRIPPYRHCWEEATWKNDNIKMFTEEISCVVTMWITLDWLSIVSKLRFGRPSRMVEYSGSSTRV